MVRRMSFPPFRPWLTAEATLSNITSLKETLQGMRGETSPHEKVWCPLGLASRGAKSESFAPQIVVFPDNTPTFAVSDDASSASNKSP
eukprot:6198533-Pleurochrysis_carterae.AAC.6